MSDEQARQVYEQAGLGGSLTLGTRPAVLVVDFQRGFTEPEAMAGADLTEQVEAARTLLDAARAKGLPVVYTTIGYEPHMKDAALWPRRGRRCASWSWTATGSTSIPASPAGTTRWWS